MNRRRECCHAWQLWLEYKFEVQNKDLKSFRGHNPATLHQIILVCYFIISAMNDDSETTVDAGRNGNIPQKTNRLVKAKNYKQGWNNDLLALSKFVKEQVFYVVVHDFKNDSDDPLDVNKGAICQHLYLKKFPSKVSNIHMKRATKEEMTAYLKDLWSTALNAKGKGNIRRELSSEKSAVYAAINEAFRSKSSTRDLGSIQCLSMQSNSCCQN